MVVAGHSKMLKSRTKKAKRIVTRYPLWENKTVLPKTKISIFNSNVKSVLLYGCETWEMSAHITDKLQTLVDRYMQGIMGVRCDEIASNTDEAVGCHWRESCNITN
jgi:hypothetical protein